MTAAGGDSPVVTAPRERGWRWLVLALAAALAVSRVAVWPASLALIAVVVRWLFPVEPFLLLVMVGVGACAVASWARGGRVTAVLATLLGVMLWVWWSGRPVAGGLRAFEHGWALMVGACFGWSCLPAGGRPFFGRVLPAIAIAGVVIMALVAWRTPAGGTGLASRFEETLDLRRGQALMVWQDRVRDPSWMALGARVPSVVRSAERTAAWLASAEPPVRILPALLVLETLAALALAWALWHRLTRTRLGPPLAPLSQFRFSDQLVWGLVAGATLVLLPSLEGWYDVGVNLLVVFGALHALRGLGVLLWWLPERWAVLPLLVMLVCLPLLGPVPVLATVAVLALGLGLGDTWRDFRRTAQPLRPDPRP